MKTMLWIGDLGIDVERLAMIAVALFAGYMWRTLREAFGRHIWEVFSRPFQPDVSVRPADGSHAAAPFAAAAVRRMDALDGGAGGPRPRVRPRDIDRRPHRATGDQGGPRTDLRGVRRPRSMTT
jgi:hypothetical protein